MKPQLPEAPGALSLKDNADQAGDHRQVQDTQLGSSWSQLQKALPAWNIHALNYNHPPTNDAQNVGKSKLGCLGCTFSTTSTVDAGLCQVGDGSAPVTQCMT